MKNAAVVFSAAAVMAMTAVSVPTPVEARGGWGWGPGIAGGLIAGALIGGLASNAYGYGYGPGYYGYYGGTRTRLLILRRLRPRLLGRICPGLLRLLISIECAVRLMMRADVSRAVRIGPREQFRGLIFL